MIWIMKGGARSAGWYVIGTLTIAWIFAYLDRQAITLLIRSLKVDLALSDTLISIVQGLAFALFFAWPTISTAAAAAGRPLGAALAGAISGGIVQTYGASGVDLPLFGNVAA